MTYIKLGHDSREKFHWKELPIEYSDSEYNGKLVVTINRRLWKKVKNLKIVQEKGYSPVILIDGPRRSGKSTIAKTIMYLLNPYCTINNYVSGLEEAPQKIEQSKDADVLIFDEGSLVANSKEVMSKKNVQLEKIVDVCGVKRLVLIFCMPDFFNISRPIAVQHSFFLIHVCIGKNLERGKFWYFSTKRKNMLYGYGKKNHVHSYNFPHYSWNGKFEDFHLPFETEYMKLKMQSLNEALNPNYKKEKPPNKSQLLTEFMIKFKDNCPEVPNETIWKGFGIGKTEYYRRRGIKLGVRSSSRASIL